MAADLEFRISAELTEIKAALASLRKDLASTGQAAQAAGGNNAFKGVQDGARSAVAGVGRLVAGFVTLAGVMKAIAAADELTTLNARLKLATSSVEEFTRAQVALFELSQRTRSSLTETIELYSRIALATKDAGVGQETLLQVVETINQAVQLSGASTQAAQAALVQLGQGLASGTLRGEELNSVLEQTPALADAIAKGMGITRGELRKYGEEGKITAQQVIQALQNQRAEIARQFATLPLTVGQSVTLVKNAVLSLVGDFDTASGATSGLASVIGDFATWLASDEVRGAIIEFSATWSNAFRAIVDDAGEAVRIIQDATRNIVGSGEDIVQIIGRAFRELPVNIRTSIQLVTVQAIALFDRLVSYATFVKDNFKAIFTDDTQDAAYRRFQARNAAINEALRGSVDAAFAERDNALATARAAREEAARRRAEGGQASNRTGLGNFRATQTDAQRRAAEQLRKAELDAQEKLAADSAKRQLATLDQQFELSEISAEAYYRRRTEIELAALDRSIAIERERAKAGGVEATKAKAEIEILEREKTDVINKAARDRAEFQRNQDRALEQARIALLQAQGNEVEAARLRAEATYRDLLARLVAQGDQAGVDLIRKLINTEVLDAELSKLNERISLALGDLRGTEQLVAAQVDARLLTEIEAERQLQEVRARSLEQLKQYRDALVAIAAAQTANGGMADPRVTQQIKALDAEIARVTASQKTLENNIRQSATNSLTGFFTDLATGARSFSDAVKAAALSFIQSLARMAAEALAKRAILALGGGGSGGGGPFAWLAQFLQFHGGGKVGAGGTPRMVNPLVFAGAPRFHNGSGVLGLKSDEVPAILQTGEQVLSREQVANGQGGGGSGYRIVNVLDPGLVSNYLESAAGERTVMNVIGRNPSQVRQLIGA